MMVDDFSRMVFVYVMKDKTKESVAEALRTHFLKVRCQPSRLNSFTHRRTIKSDMGSEFINHLVKSLCAEIGCVQEFSCRIQLPGWGKVAERHRGMSYEGIGSYCYKHRRGWKYV